MLKGILMVELVLNAADAVHLNPGGELL